MTLHVPPRQLSYWSDAQQQWVLDSGGRTVWVGDADSPASLPLQATLKKANKNITCSNQQFNATTIDGNLSVTKGDWCDLVDVTVNGNLQLNQASGVRVVGGTVNGNLQANNVVRLGRSDELRRERDLQHAPSRATSRSTGSDSDSPWHIGACGPNSVGGNLQFQQNDGTGNTITGTTVKGNLQCDHNADVTGSGNTVGGNRQGQCAGL